MAEDETKTLLEKIHKATVKQATIMGTISTAVKGIPGMLLGLFTDAITTGAKMEEQVAKLGASFGSFGKDMFKASEAFQKAGIPINVYEAMILCSRCIKFPLPQERVLIRGDKVFWMPLSEHGSLLNLKVN